MIVRRLSVRRTNHDREFSYRYNYSDNDSDNYEMTAIYIDINFAPMSTSIIS